MTRFNFLLAFSLLLIASCKTAATKESAESEQKFNNPVEFNSDSAYSYIASQVAFGPRVPGSEAHSACADYIISRLSGADSIIVQKCSAKNFRGESLPLTNIMGRFNLGAPRRILLVAHWDTRPWADNDNDKNNHATPIDGANDGGSGVGVLLELARLFGEKMPAVGVDMLFVDGEDSGDSSNMIENNDDTWCLGTQYWVNHTPYSPDNLPAYGILLDMVGGRNARFYREYASELNASAINSKVWAMANASGYGDRFINTVRGAVNDDHIHINKAGIPTIDIIECGNSSTGSFPPTWHTLQDNMDNIDAATLKAVGQTVANTIYLEKN